MIRCLFWGLVISQITLYWGLYEDLAVYGKYEVLKTSCCSVLGSMAVTPPQAARSLVRANSNHSIFAGQDSGSDDEHLQVSPAVTRVSTSVAFEKVPHAHSSQKIRIHRSSNTYRLLAPRSAEEGWFAPYGTVVKQYTRITYIISQQMPELHVNSEGYCAQSLYSMLAWPCLVLTLTALGPFLLPFAVIYSATFASAPHGYDSVSRGQSEPDSPEHRCGYFVIQALLLALSTLPLYLLWTMTAALLRGGMLQEFRRPENPIVELVGPYICVLIQSLVFLANVYHCCIQKSVGRMLVDEMLEIKEQELIMRKIAGSMEREVEHMVEEVQDLCRYIDAHIQERQHVLSTEHRRLTSDLMYAVFAAIQVAFETDQDNVSLVA